MAYRRRVNAVRRRTGWDIGPTISTQEVVSADGSVLFSGAQQTLGDGHTICRIRGEILVAMTSFSAADDAFKFAFGIGVTTSEAFAAGVASLKLPLSDQTWEGWMWHSYGHVAASMLSAAGNFGPASVWRCPVDTKAMRKLEDNDILYCVGEFDEVNDGASCIVMGQMRTLLMLP